MRESGEPDSLCFALPCGTDRTELLCGIMAFEDSSGFQAGGIFLLLLEGRNLKKFYGDRLIVKAEELSVYTGDKIGIVGANGSGKTTLLRLLAGDLEPDEGSVVRKGAVSFCRQECEMEDWAEGLPGEAEKLWKVREAAKQTEVSGGEEMRLKLSRALCRPSHILFLDEPTANLDIEGIRMLTELLGKAETFLCISHDRAFLDQICSSVWEIEEGEIRKYSGSYSDYAQSRQEERRRKELEYLEYQKEKSRLEQVAEEKRKKAQRMVKVPRGMDPKEARMRNFLCIVGRNYGGKQKSMHQAAVNAEKRAAHLEVREKPREPLKIRLCFERTDPPENKRVIQSSHLSFSYEATGKVIFSDTSFSVTNGRKTAVIGPNGCGKTTLLRLIGGAKTLQDMENPIRIVPKARLGILTQNLAELNRRRSVLDNVLENSVQTEAAVRAVLDGLLFSPGSLNQPAGLLSGGEKVKLALAMLLVSASNVLLLDEPTNYLDLPSMEAVQEQIRSYEGTVLYVSHDRELVNRTADDLLVIRDRKIYKFHGNLEQFEESEKRRGNLKPGQAGKLTEEDRLLLELEQARLAGQLARAKSPEEKEELERRFWEVTEKLRNP